MRDAEPAAAEPGSYEDQYPHRPGAPVEALAAKLYGIVCGAAGGALPVDRYLRTDLARIASQGLSNANLEAFLGGFRAWCDDRWVREHGFPFRNWHERGGEYVRRSVVAGFDAARTVATAARPALPKPIVYCRDCGGQEHEHFEPRPTADGDVEACRCTSMCACAGWRPW